MHEALFALRQFLLKRLEGLEQWGIYTKRSVAFQGHYTGLTFFPQAKYSSWLNPQMQRSPCVENEMPGFISRSGLIDYYSMRVGERGTILAWG